MLMVSRRVGERIIIGGEVEVTIREIHRSTVKLAISAPAGHPVVRGEVRDAVARENKAAAESAAALDAESLLARVAPKEAAGE
jgi:carbon storage regulator